MKVDKYTVEQDMINDDEWKSMIDDYINRIATLVCINHEILGTDKRCEYVASKMSEAMNRKLSMPSALMVLSEMIGAVNNGQISCEQFDSIFTNLEEDDDENSKWS